MKTRALIACAVAGLCAAQAAEARITKFVKQHGGRHDDDHDHDHDRDQDRD
jgi:hypothetical protein